MKKLALLLAALSVASVSYAKEVVPEPVVEEVVVEEAVVAPVAAAPVLRVTSIGQTLEVDNTSGAEDIGEGVHLANTVGLAFGDNWTFELMARKTWSASADDWYDEDGNKHSDGVKSVGHRVDLSATRHFENFTVGVKWRTEDDIEKFYLPVTYNYGMLSGWAEPAFVNHDDQADDSWYLEAMPVILKSGPVALGYHFEGERVLGSFKDHEYEHQARLMFDLYSTENFRLGAEYWYQFASEYVYEDQKHENRKHVGVLSAAYDVTENLTVDGYYRYDFNKYHEFENKPAFDNDYYGEFAIGWTYNF